MQTLSSSGSRIDLCGTINYYYKQVKMSVLIYEKLILWILRNNNITYITYMFVLQWSVVPPPYKPIR